MHVGDIEFILFGNSPSDYMKCAIHIKHSDDPPNCDESIPILEGSQCNHCLQHGNTRTLEDMVEVFQFVIRLVNHSIEYGYPKVPMDLYIQFMAEWTNSLDQIER